MKSETESQISPEQPTRMSEPRRQHPVAALTSTLRTLRELLIPLVLVFFLGGGRDDGLFSNPYYISIFLTFLLVAGVMQWMRFTYRVEDDELRIEYGLLVRKRSYIPRHRIQVIDISSGILQRMFGLVSLNVQTAGGGAEEARISALTIEDARWIKENLSRDDSAEKQAALGDGTEAKEKPKPEYRLSWNTLFLAGTTSGSFGVALSIVGTLFAQMNVVMDDDVILEIIDSFAGTSATFFITIGIGLIFIAWILSIVGTILSYANFEIYKRPKELLISRGLFEKRQITIPYSRIQAVRIQEGILRQPIGYCTLYVDSAGYGDQSGRSTVLFPMLKLKDAKEFISTMVPDYSREIDLVTPPARALRRYIIRTMIPFAALIGLFYWLFPFGHWALLTIPVAVTLGYYRYRAAAAGHDDDTITIRYRNLAKTTAFVKRHRVQSVSGWDNWFQRRRGLKSLTVNIASSDTGASFSALDFEEDTVLDYVEWVEPNYLSKPRAESNEVGEKPDSDKTSSAERLLDPGF
ncbi:MAG: PH domain-containing protein [Balneolia bacterium]|nr:PH domain-containing protein [Balneolia bacterium]